MKTATISSMKKLLVAAAVVLAPAGVALAAQDTSGDPFAAYRRAFNAGGPASEHRAGTPQAGAQGPAGPLMTVGEAACRDDPHFRVRHALWGDGPAYECAVSSGGRAGAQGPAGPILSYARSGDGDPFGPYHDIFTAD